MSCNSMPYVAQKCRMSSAPIEVLQGPQMGARLLRSSLPLFDLRHYVARLEVDDQQLLLAAHAVAHRVSQAKVLVPKRVAHGLWHALALDCFGWCRLNSCRRWLSVGDLSRRVVDSVVHDVLFDVISQVDSIVTGFWTGTRVSVKVVAHVRFFLSLVSTTRTRVRRALWLGHFAVNLLTEGRCTD